MNYLDTLKTEAEQEIRPLADVVARREKELAAVMDRIKYETENVERAEAVLAAHKQTASVKIASATSGWREWENRLGRLKGDIASARAALEVLKSEVRPAAERDLATAKDAVQCALIDLVKSHLPEVEKEMAALIGNVLAERDEFMAAADFIFAEYGGDFTGARRLYPDGAALRADPLRSHLMIATGLSETPYDPMDPFRSRSAYLPLTPPEATQDAPSVTSEPLANVELPQSGVPGVPEAAPKPLGDAPTASLDPSVEAAPCREETP